MSQEIRGLGKRLESAAPAIAEFLTLQSSNPSLETLLHGDYKAANMFLLRQDYCGVEVESSTMMGVAVLDFQYAGLGLGAEDVIRQKSYDEACTSTFLNLTK
ncbi:hypothetical protein ACA910_020055 [Epithemia clementina (nom. ined.)]